LKSGITVHSPSCNAAPLRGRASRAAFEPGRHHGQSRDRETEGVPAPFVWRADASGCAADVSLGERKLGTITVDDEDGDRSFAFAMKVPVGRPVIQDYLRRLFENDKLTVAGRLKKTDSVELNNGPDFLGVISADDQDGSTFTLQMAILDVDLDDEE
jgi:hypothetical protein